MPIRIRLFIHSSSPSFNEIYLFRRLVCISRASSALAARKEYLHCCTTIIILLKMCLVHFRPRPWFSIISSISLAANKNGHPVYMYMYRYYRCPVGCKVGWASLADLHIYMLCGQQIIPPLLTLLFNDHILLARIAPAVLFLVSIVLVIGFLSHTDVVLRYYIAESLIDFHELLRMRSYITKP